MLHCSPYIQQMDDAGTNSARGTHPKAEERTDPTKPLTLATIAFQGTVIFDRCPPSRFLASLLATVGKGEFGMEGQSFSPALEGEHGEHE